MQQPIISVSGMRGIVGQSLHPLNVIQYVAAFAQESQAGPVVVTRDGRGSGPVIMDAVRTALAGLGRECLDGGIAATPTTGVLVRQHRAAAGIQISASHNPAEYNGLKLFGPDGRVISERLGHAVVNRMGQAIPWANHNEVGKTRQLTDTISQHLKLVGATVNVELIQKKDFSVLLDSNAGAGSLAARGLFEMLQVSADFVGDEPNGQFLHEPEPIEENLRNIAKQNRENEYDVVFCQDPDADRLALIDENGTYIGEEYTLALTLNNRLQQEPGPCVINCATSRMSIDIAAINGCQSHLAAVGEANVCDMMVDVGAVYGGEGNGGPIDPRVGLVRDSFVGMAQILELMSRTGKTISQLVSEIPSYAICKKKITINTDRLPKIYSELKTQYSDAEVSELDGLRFDWPDRWLLVRPSNTEPIVRVICEAKSRSDSESLAQHAMEICAAVEVGESPSQ